MSSPKIFDRRDGLVHFIRDYTDPITNREAMQTTQPPRITFKGCPRCLGDLVQMSDWYGAYIDCVQCGYIEHREASEWQVEAQ